MDNVDQEIDSRIGNLMQDSWEVILLIFSYLSYKDITRVQTVCKTWQLASKKVLLERKRIHYLTINSPDCIFGHNKAINFSCEAVKTDIPYHIICDFFAYVTSKPKWCLLFCNEDIWLKRKKPASVTRCIDYLSKIWWSSRCRTCIIVASGIIGTVENDFQGIRNEYCKKLSKEFFSECIDLNNLEQLHKNENELDLNSKVCCKIGQSNVGYSIEVEGYSDPETKKLSHPISLLLIPEHIGVNIKYISLNSIWFTGGTALRFETYHDYDQFVISEIGEAIENIKALLIFDVELEDDFLEHFLTHFSERQNKEIAIGGGMVETYHYSGHMKFNSIIGGFGLAFYGDNVTAASVIIPQSAKSFSDVEKSILELKACKLPENKSIAFIFICWGRDLKWYSRSQVESRAFRKHFLNTPLFGFFGNGVIGNSFLPWKTIKKTFKEPSCKKKKPIFHYQYSSVIVLLSFL